jgi:hypothetical protein
MYDNDDEELSIFTVGSFYNYNDLLKILQTILAEKPELGKMPVQFKPSFGVGCTSLEMVVDETDKVTDLTLS